MKKIIFISALSLLFVSMLFSCKKKDETAIHVIMYIQADSIYTDSIMSKFLILAVDTTANPSIDLSNGKVFVFDQLVPYNSSYITISLQDLTYKGVILSTLSSHYQEIYKQGVVLMNMGQYEKKTSGANTSSVASYSIALTPGAAPSQIPVSMVRVN
jgi:hypothetical protein